jgi:hypothetical protein
VRFRLRTEAPQLGALLDWALSGAGMEAWMGGAHLHRDRAPVGWAATRAKPDARKAGRGPRPTAGPPDPDHVARVPKALPESKRTPDRQAPAGLGVSESGAQAPDRRPGDLEDYLL